MSGSERERGEKVARRVRYTVRDDVAPYVTLDGSEIRELMHPGVHGNANQSLAEATVKPGSRTQLHRHLCSEEIYHVLSGTGLMTLDAAELVVKSGDSVCIDPGVAHRLENTGAVDLVVLCCCAPPYSHEDTELLR